MLICIIIKSNYSSNDKQGSKTIHIISCGWQYFNKYTTKQEVVMVEWIVKES